jgi:hypothetical protein
MATTGSGKAEAIVTTVDKPKRTKRVRATIFQQQKLDTMLLSEVQPGMTIEKLAFGERIVVTKVKRKSERVYVINGRREDAFQRVIVRERA